MTTEKRTWECRVCGHEQTPRCPTCRVVITGLEASAGKCNTCGSPITHAIYTCPECHTENALQPPAAQTLQPWRGRGLAVKGLRASRLLVGTAQMVGLILLAVSCSAAAGGGTASTDGPSLGTLQLGGFLTFIGLIPVQILIARAIKILSYGTVVIGERQRRPNEPRR